MRRLLVCVLIGTFVSASALTAVSSAQPAATAPVVVDGPSADIQSLGGMAISRDGTGGVVYVKNVGGVAHVFVSRLAGGVFQGPEQLDTAFTGPSSQPVIAAGNGGLLLVAFINGGQLYVVDRAATSTPYSAPLALVAGAASPAIAISNFGKAYLAFTAAGAGGHDVRAAYYDAGRWALASAPLDAVPADDAGTGAGRPAVAAAGDGVGIVSWGEAGHVYTRRVWGTAPSIVFEQADVASLGAWGETSADEPSVAVGGDSSYADVAFREVFSNGSAQQSRVLMNHLQASRFTGVVQPDGLSTPGPDSADQPQAVMGEYGRGFVTSARTGSDQVFAMNLGTNGGAGALARVDTLPNASLPDPVPAVAGLSALLIAWQHDPGTFGGSTEVRVRYAPANGALAPEMVLSSPAMGPTDAAAGLAAGGDIDGDAAVAWVQGTPGALQIVVGELLEAPGAISVRSGGGYARTTRPTLSWSPGRQRLGSLTYSVSVDGVEIGQTTSTSLRAPEPLGQGPHAWQVVGVNQAGLATGARSARVFVDTIPPVVSLDLTGRLRVTSRLHLRVAYTDAPPPLPPADASGVVGVKVNWGDGTFAQMRRSAAHAYGRPGRYRVTVTVTDRAGNSTTTTRIVKITSPPKKKPKKPKHG